MAEDAAEMGADDIATADPEPEAAEAVPAETEPDNEWDGVTSSIGDEMLSDLEDATEGAEGDEAEPEGEPTPEAEAEDTPEGETPEAPEADAEGEEPDGEAEADEGPEPRSEFERFELVAEDEDAEVGMEWPEDVALRFKADDEVHEVDDPEELVELAQKGVNYGRRSRDLAQKERQVEQVVEQHREALQTAEDLLIQAVFDEDAREEMAEKLEPYRDPEVREAKRDAARWREHEERSEEQGQEEAAEEFWSEVESEVEGNLEEFEYLDDGDTSIVMQQWYGMYESALEELQPQARQAVEQGDLEEDEAARWLHDQASTVLTEENLLAVMETLDQHYADKVQPRQQAEEETSEDGDADVVDLEERKRERDEYIESKKEDEAEKAAVTGGGGSSIPSGGGSGSEDSEPETFDERMEDIMGTLEAAKE